MTSINQKEYLKRYLGLGKEKKKKKKKDKVTVKTVKIIDDNDFDTDKAIQEDLNAVDEDAPQIVAVIDERPPSLRVDEQRNKLWIPLGQTETEEVKTTGFNFRIKKEKDEGSTRKRRTLQDLSPPRGGVVIKTEPGLSPENEDLSPPRRSRNEDLSPPRSNRTEDLSPPRRNRIEDLSPPRRGRNEDLTPPRRKRTEDLSPPQRRKNEDLSPPRRTTNKDLSPPRRNKNIDLSPPRRIKTEDLSPPRRKRQDSDGDLSPPRKRKPDTTDLSPPRRKRLNSSGDLSPPRRRTEDLSPPRRKERDLSPPRRKQTDLSPPRRKKSRWAESSSPPPTIKIEETSPPRQQGESSPRRKDKKMSKTLDGKKAGLQNAVELMKETVAMKKREEEMFRNMSAEVSGANAKTVVRNRKPVDKEEEARKEMKEREMKEKYSKWGKGIKQVDDHNERLQQELYEMSKPLARYADDEDLERYLKEQEREGDPMLAYIRKKKKKVAVEAGIPSKPEYMGEFMPNRFGIRPGYRWDGVDRSNGYEKKWFDVQNSKKASLEESYKWNVEDM